MEPDPNPINPNIVDYYLTLRKVDQHPKLPHPKKQKPHKERPNFFIAIQVTDTTISTGIQQVQDIIKSRLPDLQPRDFIKLHKLHITAFVLCIKTAEDLLKVVSVIESMPMDVFCTNIVESKEIANKFFPNGTLPAIGLQGVRAFDGHRVIWIDLENGNDKEILIQYIDTLHQFFKDNLAEVGFEKKKFLPHITLFKSRRKSKHNKVHPEHYEACKSQLFGRQSVQHLMLVAMEEEDPVTRFYKCVCKFDFASSSCVVANDPSTFYFRKRKLSSSSDEPQEKRHEGQDHDEENNNNNTDITVSEKLIATETDSVAEEQIQPVTC